MSTEHIDSSPDNVILLAVIASVVLHLTALYSRVDLSAMGEASRASTDSEPARIEIPVEFIPLRAQVVDKAHVSRDKIYSIIEEAEKDNDKTESIPQVVGHYSFIHRQALLKHYLSEVREEIESHKYVTDIRRQSLIGNVTVSFDILADGSFRRVVVLHSSGHNDLDRAAVTAVEMSSNKIKRPNTTGSRKITASVVIKYQFGL